MPRPPRRHSPLRRAIAAIAVVALALIGVSLGSASASATPGYSISGTVSDTSSVGVGSLSVFVYDGSDAFIEATTTAPDGTYSLDGLVPGTYTLETSSATGYVSYQSPGIEITAADVAGVDFTVTRYGVLSGTVSNAIGLPAGSIEVYADYWDGSSWSTHGDVSSVDTTDGTYSVPAVDVTGEYRILFTVEDDSLAVFSTYYGDTLGSPDPSTSSNAGIVNATAETDQAGLNATLVAAGYITGTVTSTGLPVVGELVDAYDSVSNSEYDADTDSSGDYRIKVVANTPYLVESGGDNGYEYQAFDGHNGCDCTFDPVTVGAGLTKPGIDFDLVREGGPISILALLLGDDGSGGSIPLSDGTVNLYQAVTGGYSLTDSENTDSSGQAILGASSAGDYRIRVSHTDSTPLTTWYPIEAYVVFNPADLTPPTPVVLPDGTCYLPLPGLQPGDELAVIMEITDDSTVCGPEPAPVVPTAPVRHRHSPGTTTSALLSPTPTATPTPTPTPTETPSASPSPSASATPAPKPASSQGGMPWLIWLLIILAVILIIGALAFILLRRR